jgi:ABC-type antimicrobial peptide transport system permease subunit
MALGARHGQIEWLVMRQIAGLLAGGSAAGIALAWLAGKAVAGMLFGVQPGDPRLLAGALVVLGATALAAAWLPARRAAAVDPLVALRHE